MKRLNRLPVTLPVFADLNNASATLASGQSRPSVCDLSHTGSSPWDLKACCTHVLHRGIFGPAGTQVLHRGIFRSSAHKFSTVGSSGLSHPSSSPWDLQACRTYVPHRGIFRPVAHTFSTGDLQACRTQGGRLVDAFPFVRFAIVTICKKPNLQAVRFARGLICKWCGLQEAQFSSGAMCKWCDFARGPICKRCG